jgi:hypothetical protein
LPKEHLGPDSNAPLCAATATSPTDDYDIKDSVFNGKIDRVRIDLGDEKFQVAHEDRLRIAMTRQQMSCTGNLGHCHSDHN